MKTIFTTNTKCSLLFQAFLTSLFLIFISGSQISAQNFNKNHPALKSKQFSRQEWLTSARADSNGRMGNYQQALKTFQNSTAEREIPDNYQSAQWYSLGPSKPTDEVLSQLGLVASIWIDTTDFQTIYAGSNTGGIFRTTDGGQNWASLSDNYLTTGVLSIQVDPTDKNIIYIGTGNLSFGRAYGNGVMKSMDGGLSWESTGLNSETMAANFTIRKLFIIPQQPGTMLALANTEFRQKGFIYRTTDSAETWEAVYSDNRAELFSIVQDPSNPETIYATGNRFLKSTDAGITWNDQSTTLTLDTNYVISRVEVAKTPSNPNLMLVMSESYDTTGENQSAKHRVFKSTDDGLSYSDINLEYNPFSGYWKMEFKISPTDENEFYLGGIWLYKYRIEEDSAKYIFCSNHRYHHDIRDLHVFPGKGKDLMFMANDGGVSKSETGAESWYDITRNGMNITQFHNITIGENSNMMYAGPQDANLSFYNFQTGVWAKNAKVSDAYDGAIDHTDPNIVYLVSVPPNFSRPHIFLLKSVDGGNFFNYYGIPDSTEIGRNDKPLVMDREDHNTLYVGVRNVWKTTDGAETWQKISNFPADGEPKLISIRIAPSNNKVIAAAFENPNWGAPNPSKLWITPDGGNHWFNITPTGSLNLEYAGISDITFHPEQPNKFWLSLDREWENRRVYMTSDGGTTWQNYSEGLPVLPIITITYVEGAGYDVLLAATDAGIYYRDETMTRWERYGTGLPLTIVSDIEISYSRKKIIAGTFGRGLWEADLCLPLTEGELVINDTVEWSGKRKVLQDVVINKGGRLTIKADIEMGIDRTIHVKPGGELIVDNADISNDCVGLWNGIRLYGSADYNNQDLPQGKISLLHGGSIQYADTAIKTIGLDEQGNIISGAGGGIIYAHNAKFINNIRAIELNPTSGNNPSTFTLCQFLINKTLPDGTIPGDLVTIKSSDGIKFTSCQFENLLPLSPLPYRKRGIGINSFNSSFTVDKLPSIDSIPFGINTNALFRQLATGIHATTSTPADQAHISNARFERNLTGVYLAGMNLSTIKNSYFNLNSPSINDSLTPSSAAIYMDHCAYSELSGNTIKGPLGIIVPKSKSTGIIVNQCGETNQIIYGNSISNTNYALIAQNENRSEDGFSGLRIAYNWFNGNEYDICITNDSAQTNNGIALHQGSTGANIGAPAGNRFSRSKLHRDSDIHNAGKNIFYHYFNNADSLNREPVRYFQVYPVKGIMPFPADSAFRPDYLAKSGDILAGQFAYYNELIGQMDENFHSKLDNGNKALLLAEIESCTPARAPDLIARLLKISPFLSPEILSALVLQQRTIPNVLIHAVLQQNPHFIRNRPLMEAIEGMSPPLTNYMIAQLANLYNHYSGLELQESLIADIRARRDFLFGKLAFEFSNPELSDDQQTLLIAHLRSDDRPESHYLAALIALDAGQTTIADDILTQMPVVFDNLDTDKHAHLESLVEFNKLINSNGTLPDILNSEQTELLYYLMQFPETEIFAINALEFFKLLTYNHPYIFPGSYQAVQPPAIPPVAFSGNGFTVYPVPARDYVVVDYYSEAGLTNGLLQIHNISGQLSGEFKLTNSYGQQIIDISQLSAGTYLFVLKDGFRKISEQKVIISR